MIELRQEHKWLNDVITGDILNLELLYGGIGKRRYYRVTTANDHFVLMDARNEPLAVRYYQAYIPELLAAGVHVPACLAVDKHQSQAILEDFGDQHLLTNLAANDALSWHEHVADDWQRWQSLQEVLPRFDWMSYRHKLYDIEDYITYKDKEAYYLALELLFEDLQHQPQAVCHGDLHSLNIMVLPEQKLGYLDFQAMSVGPLTYDWVSLLRDCYIRWSDDDVAAGFKVFYQRYAKGNNDPLHIDDAWRYFELTGLMRHLRCYALFMQRQQNDTLFAYPEHLQRIKQYINSVCERYPSYDILGAIA